MKKEDADRLIAALPKEANFDARPPWVKNDLDWEAEEERREMYAHKTIPIVMPDELSDLARDIRLMPGTISTRFQQELLDVIPKWMPARHLFARRIWQTLFVWSIKKWESANAPPIMSPISMERLSEAIMSNGLDNPLTNNPPKG